jgi:thymidylate synthase (FAD)
MIIPQNIYTQAYWTVSLQGLLHFLDERLKPEAQFEIREYAKAIQGLIEEKLRPILGAQ